MKVGAQPKKIAILGVLFLVLVYVLYTNVIASSSGIPDGARRRAAARPAAAGQKPATQPEAFGFAVPDAKPRRGPRSRAAAMTRPEFKMGTRDEQADPTKTDPTLRLDLLAKLQDVKLEGGDRNLFQFGAAPAPKAPEPKIIPNAKPAPPAPAGPPPPPPKPTAPPIPLKFYGYSSQPALGPKRAFFLDGDDIIVAVEGEVMKSRYKIVHIGINSVVVEDVQFQQQQTLPLEEPQQAGQQG